MLFFTEKDMSPLRNFTVETNSDDEELAPQTNMAVIINPQPTYIDITNQMLVDLGLESSACIPILLCLANE
jgi:hypothetical protein